jgi:hypothetical protein
MKALVWDDLINESDKHYYDVMKSTFADKGVQLEVVEEWGEFEARFLKADYAFVLIDCWNQFDELVGPARAKRIRDIVSSQASRRYDPDFPIFMISSAINRVPLEDWDEIAAVPLKKDGAVSQAGKIINHLDQRGRWNHKERVFVVRCPSDHAILPEAAGDFRRLNALIKSSGRVPIPVEFGDTVDHVAIRQISAGIRAAEKIVVVLSKDNQLAAPDRYVARPSVYVELGYLILAFDGIFIEKTMFCVQRGVQLPFKMNEINPVYYVGSLAEIDADIERFLGPAER